MDSVKKHTYLLLLPVYTETHKEDTNIARLDR